MRQGASFDELFAGLKKNLWQQDEQGNWRIDPKRDALRMANHTRVFHYKPSRAECIESVRSQYYSGEGAIQWAGEAVKRASVDVLQTPAQQKTFLTLYDQDGPGQAGEYLATCYREVTGAYITPEELSDRMERYKLNPCGEIIFNNNFCDLAEIHLNRISPFNFIEQEEAFRAGGIAVAALLHHEFVDERYARSRSFDPIVGVSFTGLFDFFVTLFGVGWLRWLEAGRPDEWGDTIEYTALGDLWDVAETLLPAILMEDSNPEGLYYWRMSRFYKEIEAAYLRWWRFVAETSVWDYCDRHSLKRPNRCTTIQPSGTKALLTGASPGWHPPKAQRFIRRITFSVSDPVALACRDYGYPVVPSQSDKDENGMLLDDPFDPRTTEWLVEIPVEASWANLPGVDAIDINQISALAQFDFYMQAQVHYVGHNGSATIELREEEIEALGDRIYRAIQNDEGYISACLLSRSNSPYPRLPYEPITKQQYDELSKQAVANRRGDFHTCLTQHDKGEDRFAFDASPGGCDSDKCLFPEYTP
jgi:ribonucleotide reductase class II